MQDMNDFNFDEASSESSIQPPSQFQIMFNRMTGDMRFVGIFTIIMGALNCLSIFGAIIGIPMIFVGIRMREAADHFDIFRNTNDVKALRMGFEQQGKLMNILKIIVIIEIVLVILVVLLLILGVFSGLMMSGGGYDYGY